MYINVRANPGCLAAKDKGNGKTKSAGKKGVRSSAKLKAKKATAKSTKTKAKVDDSWMRQPAAKALLRDIKTLLSSQAAAKTKRFRRNPLGREELPLRVMTDCAGIGADCLALKALGMRKQVKLVNGSEWNERKRKLFAAVHKAMKFPKPARFEKDLTKRDVEKVPGCDLYIAGFPCPSFSNLGKRQGANSPGGAGYLMLHGVKYIARRRPTVVILEQVASFGHRKHQTLRELIMRALTKLDYEVHVKVLNTCDHGIAQSRRRWYMVALQASRIFWPFHFPEPLAERTDLHHFLMKDNVGQEVLELPKKYNKKYGKNVWQKGFIVDVGSSERFVHAIANCSPCLTRSRLMSNGYYIPKLKRRLLTVEAGALQGWPSELVEVMQKALPDDEEKHVRAALGDGMSVNVLMRVIQRALTSVELMPDSHDAWELCPRNQRASLMKRLHDESLRLSDTEWEAPP